MSGHVPHMAPSLSSKAFKGLREEWKGQEEEREREGAEEKAERRGEGEKAEKQMWFSSRCGLADVV